MFTGTTLICLLLFFGYWIYQNQHSASYHFTSAIEIKPVKPFFLDDPVMGYVNNPGNYTIELFLNVPKKPPLAFKASIDSAGRRVASKNGILVTLPQI